MAKDWIGPATSKHPGALRAATHTPEGKNITQKKLIAAAHSKDPKLAAMARLAETLHKLHHGTG